MSGMMLDNTPISQRTIGGGQDRGDDARIQTSRSSSVVRITGIAFGWIGSTTAFGAVVRKP